ncbi:unnamed protein product, partial [Symbiodinium necroappetens]
MANFKRLDLGISAIQGHSRSPDEVSKVALGECLTLERCKQLGQIFHASENANYQSIRTYGLVLEATKASWQRHRKAIRMAQQEKELNEVLRKAKTKPLHLFSYRLLHRVDSSGNEVYYSLEQSARRDASDFSILVGVICEAYGQ